MTKQICLTVLALCTILMILVVGCVTPPKGTTTSTTSGSYYATETTSSETPTPPAYVSEVTPFTTSNPGAQTTTGYNPYATPTPIAADLSCIIYNNTQFFSYNITAVSFDLKNPPMYISYSVVPFNITVNKVVRSPQGGDSWITLQYLGLCPLFVV